MCAHSVFKRDREAPGEEGEERIELERVLDLDERDPPDRLTRIRKATGAGADADAARVVVQTHHIEELPDTIERLRRDVEELRASRRRIVLAGDADRHRIERALHEGVQQDLVALAVNLQLAAATLESDPAAAKKLVDEMARDVQRSLEETAKLAQRIHPPLLDSGGLAAALRSVAVSLGLRASIEVARSDAFPPELVHAIYFCGVDLLERLGPERRATIAIRAGSGGRGFDVTIDAQVELEGLRDRVEALGGRLTIKP